MEVQLARRTPKRYRFGTILALAGAALLATSGVAVADTETGQHGHYVFKDDPTYGATCVYGSYNGKYKLTQIVVKAPKLWWLDTTSENNRERGMVGWALTVQISEPGAYGPWHDLFVSQTIVKRAYEDQPPYDNADKARLPQMTLSINGAYKRKPNAHARLIHDAFWYANGSTIGSVTHEQVLYAVQGVPGYSGLTTACPIHIVP
jgi:hypothetical protein